MLVFMIQNAMVGLIFFAKQDLVKHYFFVFKMLLIRLGLQSIEIINQSRILDEERVNC